MTPRLADPKAIRKVLVVHAVGEPAPQWVHFLASSIVIPRTAEGGLYALTMLERERPDLIVTAVHLGDMTGAELCSMVQRDNALASVRVVLVARHLDERDRATREASFHGAVLDDRPADGMAERLRQLLVQEPEREVDRPTPAQPEAKVITGSLGVLSFAELSQAFSQTGKTGCLALDLGIDRPNAKVLFAEGTVQHAEYDESRGVTAFVRLFHDAEHAEDTAFRFEPMSLPSMAEQPRTIDQTAQQLLLSAAVDLDESAYGESLVAPPHHRTAAEDSTQVPTEPDHDEPE